MQPVLIFDLDGVIADSWDLFHQEFCQLMSSIGRSDLSQKANTLKLFEGNFFEELQAAIYPQKVPPSLFQSMMKSCHSILLKAPCFKGIHHTLEQLQQQHLLHIVTSNHSSAVADFLQRHQLNLFHSIQGTDTHTSKVRKIKNVVGDTPMKDCLYIGDTLGDIVEAKSAGIKVIAASWGWHHRDTLLRGNPDGIADNPEQLIPLTIAARQSLR